MMGKAGKILAGAAWAGLLVGGSFPGWAAEPEAITLRPEGQAQAPAAQGAPLPPPRPVKEGTPLPPPRPVAPSPTEPNAETGGQALARAEACGVRGAMLLSLPVALRLAQTTNLEIAQAREVINVARVGVLRANVTALPNLNVGSTYTSHDGNIQKTEGNIEKVNRDALFIGGGPSVNFFVADAIFLPLVARQTLAATEAGFRRVNDGTLGAVADAYLTVMQGRRRLERIRETLEFLLSNQPSPNRSDSKGLFPLVRDFVQAGGPEALVSELERVRVEVLRRQEERAGILQDYYVASANLARLLRLDPNVPLWPVEDFSQPIPIPGAELLDRPVDDLATLALSNRPEIAENRALIEAALARLRAAQYRPWLPNLVLNYNWGDFGGGPDLNPSIIRRSSAGVVTVVTQAGFGPSRQLHHYNTRDDLDASLVWRLQNLGLGNLADVREQQANYRRLGLQRLQIQDLVLTDVVQTLEQIKGWRERLGILNGSLFDGQGRRNGPVFRSLRLSFDRVRNAPGSRPLEVLDSIRSLNDLLDSYAQAMTSYERSRFRLLIALGLPPQTWLDPRAVAKRTQVPGWGGPPPAPAPRPIPVQAPLNK